MPGEPYNRKSDGFKVKKSLRSKDDRRLAPARARSTLVAAMQQKAGVGRTICARGVADGRADARCRSARFPFQAGCNFGAIFASRIGRFASAAAKASMMSAYHIQP